MRAHRVVLAVVALGVDTAASAQPTIIADSGDSAWVLTATALALLMALVAPALFYGAHSGSRAAATSLKQSVVAAAFVSLIWALVGYSVAFGDGTLWLGGLGNLGMANLVEIRDGTTISEILFALFQMTFAIAAPVLAVSAFGDRVRFGWVVGFTAFWSLLVYVPLARWIWSGGWLAEQGTLDFAGGLVLHSSAGIAAAVIAILLGKRKSARKAEPHNNPVFPLLGASLIWIGSLAMIGGSSLGAGADAASAIMNAYLAASAAALIWLLAERVTSGRSTSLGVANGAIAGLASISAGADFIAPFGAVALGALGSLAAFAGLAAMRQSRRTDAALAVFAIHGIGGLVGSLAFPLFVLSELGGPGYDEGVNFGAQFAAQGVGAAVTILWTAIMSAIIALMVAMVIPMNADDAGSSDLHGEDD